MGRIKKYKTLEEQIISRRWHYTKITYKHSVKQVQNRDMIKMGEILKYGYNFYIIKDYKNKITPEIAYDKIMSLIKSNSFNATIF